MKITKRDFNKYKEAQEQSVNMWEVELVASVTGLSTKKVEYIAKNYVELSREYTGKNED